MTLTDIKFALAPYAEKDNEFRTGRIQRMERILIAAENDLKRMIPEALHPYVINEFTGRALPDSLSDSFTVQVVLEGVARMIVLYRWRPMETAYQLGRDDIVVEDVKTNTAHLCHNIDKALAVLSRIVSKA